LFMETLKRMRSASLSECDNNGPSSPVASPVGASRAAVSDAAVAAADAAAAALKEEEEEAAAANQKAKANKKKKKKNKAKKKRRKGSRTIPADSLENEDRIRRSDEVEAEEGAKKDLVDEDDGEEGMDTTMATADETLEETLEDEDGETPEADDAHAEADNNHEGDEAKPEAHGEQAEANGNYEGEEKKCDAEAMAIGSSSDALRIRGSKEEGNKDKDSNAEMVDAAVGQGISDEKKDDDSDEAMEDANAEAEAYADADAEANLSAAAKKRRKKKRKKKKKNAAAASSGPTSGATAADAATAQAIDNNNTTMEAAAVKGPPEPMPPCRSSSSVTFGSVSVREYRRAIGSSVVPADGGWPLGLSDDLVREYDVSGDVDGFEERRNVELRRRYEEVMARRLRREWRRRNSGNDRHGHHGKNHGSKGRKGKNKGGHGSGHGSSDKGKHHHSADEPKPPPELLDAIKALPDDETLETRQFDYRRRKDPTKGKKGHHHDKDDLPTLDDVDDGKNPLFGASSIEDERMHKIVHDRDAIHEGGDEDASGHGQDGKKQHEQQPSNPPCPRRSSRNRSRSSSFGNAAAARSRSNSEGGYDHVEITHVRNELEKIRSSRSGEGSIGCTCRKIHVFLPGKSEGKGHKRGSHRRMPERRVREELRRRGLLSGANASNAKRKRDELEQVLHDAVESEPCCWGDDCPCRRNGIGCQADACSCWHPGHEGGGGGHHHVTNAELNKALEDVGGVRKRCGNKNGMYVVDFAKIEEGRKRYLTKEGMMRGREVKTENGAVLCEEATMTAVDAVDN